jgi:hypothetical protein
MSSNIQQNGGTILVRQNGSDIQYSSDAGSSWNTVSSFPITLTNTNPLSTNVLTVNLTTNLIISSVLNNKNLFDCGSAYITINGQNNTCQMNGVSSFGGLIKNGTNGVNGKNNITVQNIRTAELPNTTNSLGSENGWVCHQYFGNGSSNILIDNCSNSCIVNGYTGGGICGNSTGMSSVSFVVSNCSNSGEINAGYAGGVCGNGAGRDIGNRTPSGAMRVISCSNTGRINATYAGGVCGGSPAYYGNISITGCNNSGVIASNGGGGICGAQAGYGNGNITIDDCHNTGLISGTNAGGICGSSLSGVSIITNCSNTGEINGNSVGGICGSSSQRVRIRNCCNEGNVNANSAGMVGESSNVVELINCYNTGRVGGNCGGMIANYSTCQVSTDCYNTGEINGGYGFGGLYCNGGTITRFYNTGRITGNNAAGIMGSSSYANMINCYNTGNIEGTSCGGLGSNGFSSGNVTECYNTGNISGDNCGGLFASIYGAPTITNCYSSGLLTGNNSSGITPVPNNATITNCYAANGVWTDSAANANLTGTPASSPGVGSTWGSRAANTPYLFAYLFPSISSVVASEYKIINILGSNLGAVNSVLINGNIVPASFVANESSVTVTLTNFVPIDSVQVSNPQNLSATFSVNPPLLPICFPAGTPVLTDQGIINIEKINPKIHTIQNKKIVAVTQTITNEKHLVCIEKNALGENKPNQRTLISQCHNVEFNGKFMRAKYLKYAVDNKKSVHNVKYENQILYNVLMEEHEVMSVNNMLVETLDPQHFIAKLYTGKISQSEKHNLIVEINECMKNNDMEKCKQICKRIK